MNLAALLLLLTLCACGGSDEPVDEMKSINPPDCAASPEQCK